MRWSISWQPHADGNDKGFRPERCRRTPRLPNAFRGGTVPMPSPIPVLHTKRPARFAKSQLSCRSFVQLRQQESNLRWGSQSPLPYRLAMAHHAKQYSIFSAVPQEVRRIFAAFSVCCLPHLRRFGSVFGLCGRDPAFSIFFHVFTKGKFCGMRFSKNTVRRGHKIHIAKVRFIFS